MMIPPLEAVFATMSQMSEAELADAANGVLSVRLCRAAKVLAEGGAMSAGDYLTLFRLLAKLA